MERMWICNMQRYHSLECAPPKTALHESDHCLFSMSQIIFFYILSLCVLHSRWFVEIYISLNQFQLWLLCYSLYWITIPRSVFSFLEDQLLLFQVCLIILISVTCPQCQFLYSISSPCFYLIYIIVVISEELRL